MTLAHVALRVREADTTICHAISPAVPAEATDRVRRHADAYGWPLRILDAGEFADPDYLRNPVNRCYFCKSNLYDRISERTEGTIASGANLDDLSDFRPGLDAATERRVVHPFVEAGMDKSAIRALARRFDLGDVSELPAQPCLASRIQTGLRVTPEDLAFVAEVEMTLTPLAGAEGLRCRVTAQGISVELDVDRARRGRRLGMIRQAAQLLCDDAGRRLLPLAPYRRGSAFLHDDREGSAGAG
ncbi:adenine nucleotide alpha hydrolase [Palleronia aestuarii]|nr:adenine nucleotide alpha hydrolase [Palleronia aestuarii]